MQQEKWFSRRLLGRFGNGRPKGPDVQESGSDGVFIQPVLLDG
jgi:hypothetical protein